MNLIKHFQKEAQRLTSQELEDEVTESSTVSLML